MKVGIITLTLDRLYYTYHCLKTLKEKAGYPFEHIVIDNGSGDGTVEWLKEEGYNTILNKENKGITFALRQGLDYFKDKNIDLLIKMDSDCEILTENVIGKVVNFFEGNPKKYIISPLVEGIVHRPQIKVEQIVNGYKLGRVSMLGGIFRAQPMKDFLEIAKQSKGLNDKEMSKFYGKFNLAYMLDVKVMHFETTGGQVKRYPRYFNKAYLY